MKFMFSNPQKFLLSSALKDAKEGLNRQNMHPEYRNSILKKIDRTINQLQYNSYVTEIHEEIGCQLLHLLQSVDYVLKQTDRTEFDEDATQDLETKIEVVDELIELFTEYMKNFEDQENDLAIMIQKMKDLNTRYDVKHQKCNLCDGKAYYRIKRFGKVCKSCKDKMKQKIQEAKENIDNPEELI